eukprot:1139355-Pelagomonas_calceolata.AAC.3
MLRGCRQAGTAARKDWYSISNTDCDGSEQCKRRKNERSRTGVVHWNGKSATDGCKVRASRSSSADVAAEQAQQQ